MIIQKLLRIGQQHKTHCEDFLLETNIKEGFKLFGVFDGCSSGTDSFLSSALTAKIIRGQFLKQQVYSVRDLKTILFETLWNTLRVLNYTAKALSLQEDELLTTISLLLINIESKTFHSLLLGDGLVAVDETFHRIEQDNAPKYLAYQLNNISSKETFFQYLEKESFQTKGNTFEKAALATDGIYSFASTTSQKNDVSAEAFLLKEDYLLTNTAGLARKANILHKKHRMLPADDLGIIQIINT